MPNSILHHGKKEEDHYQIMCKTFLIATVFACILSGQRHVFADSNNGRLGHKQFCIENFAKWRLELFGSIGDMKLASRSSDECQVTPVIHVLQYPGCVPKPIPSFACIGRCSSYLQVIKKMMPWICWWWQLSQFFHWFDCSVGIRKQNMADGKILHVLSRIRRKRSGRFVILSESQARRT